MRRPSGVNTPAVTICLWPRKRHRAHGVVVADETRRFLCGLRVPQAYADAAARQDLPGIWRHGHREHALGLPRKSPRLLADCGIPEPERTVLAGGDGVAAVR